MFAVVCETLTTGKRPIRFGTGLAAEIKNTPSVRRYSIGYRDLEIRDCQQ